MPGRKSAWSAVRRWTDPGDVLYLFFMFATPDSPLPLRDLFDAAVRQYGIKLTCLRCKHVRVFHAHALWYLFERRGWDDRFSEVTRRAICLPCRDKHGATIRFPKLELVREDPTGEPLQLPPREVWRRALSRNR
jgi:hypothetical protein